jgi:hypothetical protein
LFGHKYFTEIQLLEVGELGRHPVYNIANGAKKI